MLSPMSSPSNDGTLSSLRASTIQKYVILKHFKTFFVKNISFFIPQDSASLMSNLPFGLMTLSFKIKVQISPARISASSMKWVLNTVTRLDFLYFRRFQTIWREQGSIPAVGSSSNNICVKRSKKCRESSGKLKYIKFMWTEKLPHFKLLFAIQNLLDLSFSLLCEHRF